MADLDLVSVLIEYLFGAVGGRTVYNDHLEIWIGLITKRCQRLLQGLAAIVGVYDNRNAERH
jgi:hypothetical protein